MERKTDFLFEASWEVCNKVGGIYTVVKSKAAQMTKHYKDNYFLVGPYFASKARGEFSEEPPKDFCKKPFEELKKEGIVCHCGKWDVEGSPNAILIDFEELKQKVNEVKAWLWETYKVDSLRAGSDYDEPVVWSYAAGRVIEKLVGCLENQKAVAHFHEWLAGTGLLYLKEKNVKVGTVFTTHATVLGRTLASSNINLYDKLDKLNVDEEIYRYNLEAKHMVERETALHADVFTTVSEITAMEAEHLLGRKADVLVLNGLDIEKFPTFEEIAIEHRSQRSRIREFLLCYFFPHYTFDLSKTLFYFIAGRNEFHVKGIDIFIKSLEQLNNKLKEEKSDKTIVSFIWVPANARNVKAEILENKTYYQDIKDSFDDVNDEVQRNILNLIISNKKITEEKLFDRKFLMELKSKVKRFKKKGNPPISTHDLYEGEDHIIKALSESGLENKKEDPVKVVYYPTYLTGADGLLNLSYYEAMQGSHLGVFPSYYEPWGYTPLEAGALGVASVATDLSGFGRFFCNECVQGDEPGIYLLRRLGKSDEEATAQLTQIMSGFGKLSPQKRISNKMQARKIASTADWKIFIKRYLKAHNKAVEKAYS